MTMLLEWFVDRKLCAKFNLEKSEKWYLHNPQTFNENVNHKLIWDMNIQCYPVLKMLENWKKKIIFLE